MGSKKKKNDKKKKVPQNKKQTTAEKEKDSEILMEIKPSKPTISILTVSQLKRIPFLHNLSKMIEYQTDCEISEWIITNGCTTDEEHDMFNEDIKSVKCSVPIKIVASKNLEYRNIGAFRNLANRNVSGDIIVCMDDDDFYFKDYVKSCYEALINRHDIELVGCSGMLMYDYGFDTVFRLAAFGANHTVNCCLAYRRQYSKIHKYDETRKTGEEMSFLNKYQSRMYQLPPTSAIIHMSYADNTFSEKRLNMLNNMGSYIRAPTQVPNIYNPISTSLKSLMKNDSIFNGYMENFKNINNQIETDIVFYYGSLEEFWDPQDKSLNVYRRRCIDLGREFIKNGYSVSVYGKFKENELKKDGIIFYNLKYWNVRRKCKYLIFVDYTGFIPICQYERIFEKINCEKIFIDVYTNLFQFYKFVNFYNSEKITFVLKNPYHIHMNPKETKSNLKFRLRNIIVPSGVNMEIFKKDYGLEKNRKRICWTCKYDNGLLHTLKHFWPEIIKMHPDAEFHVYYGFFGVSKELKAELSSLLLQDGVHHHGRVSQEEIAKEFQRSNFLMYYTGSPNEHDCLSVMEALVAGCIPVLWNKNVFSCFHGLLSADLPMEINSYKNLAFKIGQLMTSDNERETVIDKLRNSDTIITSDFSAKMYIEAFEGKTQGSFLEPEKEEKINAKLPEKNMGQVPGGIDLQSYVDSDSDDEETDKKEKINPEINLRNYVDSDSDDEEVKVSKVDEESESDVEYEPDSDEENPDFIESTDFTGSKLGYVYKHGDKGLGYYKSNNVVENFIESTDFNGSKLGYVYKHGDKGLGYYKIDQDENLNSPSA